MIKKGICILTFCGCAACLGLVYEKQDLSSLAKAFGATASFLGSIGSLVFLNKKEGEAGSDSAAEQEISAEATGKGGSAISMEEGSDVSVKNSGKMEAGKGGSGGSGGDAIRIARGVKVEIINTETGSIRGGDAGQA